MSCVNCEIEEHIEAGIESPMAFPIFMASEPKSTTSESGGVGLGKLLVDPPMRDFLESVPCICQLRSGCRLLSSFNLRDRLKLFRVEGLGEP